MADKTKIEWTDATWNVITGCSLMSEGCRNCYAADLAAKRLKNLPSRIGLAKKNAAGMAQFNGKVRFNEEWLEKPLRWKKPRRIFVCAHGDLFHESVPDAWIDRVFAVMALSPQHTFQVLTKRPERMRDYLSQMSAVGWMVIEGAAIEMGYDLRALNPVGIDSLEEKGFLPNVWCGVSIEDQPTADTRIPYLLETPAAVRFVSAEPLLGAVDLTRICGGYGHPTWRDALRGIWEGPPSATVNSSGPFGCGDTKLDWVIVGGESGRNARPMHPDWARSLRDQCAAAGVAFLFKQNGAFAVVYDRDTEDPDWRRCGLIKRETPNGRWLNIQGGHGFHGERVVRVVPVGKNAAGRALDGVTHDGFPEGRG